jgi:O-methyltransferase
VQECIGGEYLNYCTFIIGHFPNSVPANFYNKKLSIVSIDADLYEPTKAGLEYFYPLMSEGAIFFCMTTPQLFGKVAKKQLMSFVTKKNNILF